MSIEHGQARVAESVGPFPDKVTRDHWCWAAEASGCHGLIGAKERWQVKVRRLDYEDGETAFKNLEPTLEPARAHLQKMVERMVERLENILAPLTDG